MASKICARIMAVGVPAGPSGKDLRANFPDGGTVMVSVGGDDGDFCEAEFAVLPLYLWCRDTMEAIVKAGAKT